MYLRLFSISYDFSDFLPNYPKESFSFLRKTYRLDWHENLLDLCLPFRIESREHRPDTNCSKYYLEHLPGIIEVDVLDSFKIMCRRLSRITDNAGNPMGTVTAEKLPPPK